MNQEQPNVGYQIPELNTPPPIEYFLIKQITTQAGDYRYYEAPLGLGDKALFAFTSKGKVFDFLDAYERNAGKLPPYLSNILEKTSLVAIIHGSHGNWRRIYVNPIPTGIKAVNNKLAHKVKPEEVIFLEFL